MQGLLGKAFCPGRLTDAVMTCAAVPRADGARTSALGADQSQAVMPRASEASAA